MAFDAVDISNRLYGIVGLRESFDPTKAILNAENQESRSGYFANDNTYVKVDMVKDSQDFKDITYEQFNEYLANLQKAAIKQVCNNIFDEPDFRERQLVYQYAINKVNTYQLPEGFACYKIYKRKDNNVAFKINRVILDFEGTGTINLQLYSSQQTTPLFEKEITINSPDQVEDLGWVVNNTGVDYKGQYLLGYVTNSDLRPYIRDYEGSDYFTYFRDIFVDDRIFLDHTTSRIPNLDLDSGVGEYIGINPDITVYDDYTDLILREEQLLAKAIDLQYQITLLNSYSSSSRSNLNERYGKDFFNKIAIHINGLNRPDSVRITGVKEVLHSEINQIRKQLQKIKKGFKGGRLINRTIN